MKTMIHNGLGPDMKASVAQASRKRRVTSRDKHILKTTILYKILRRATVAQTSRAVARGFFMSPSIPSRKRRASVADVAGSKQTVAQASRKRRGRRGILWRSTNWENTSKSCSG